MGITAPPLDLGLPGSAYSYVIEGDVKTYYLILVITVLMVIGARNLMKTRVGRAFVAIRDDDIAAEVMGVNLTIFKTLSFAVSAFYAGVAGGLYAFVVSFFDPFTFNLILSIIFLVMVVVGGLGSILGAVMGAALITYLQFDLLKNVEELPYLGEFLVLISRKWLTVIGLANFGSIALGLIMLGIVIFEPLGMFGIWIRIKKYWKTWPF
ncbi:MAG: branched-chain amino acid ABC transporter permease [Deltaproteobacteria bacterium]|nr:branched-chain amino acid ABC transporter permease [Deltaproteobacteria bacterium]